MIRTGKRGRDGDGDGDGDGDNDNLPFQSAVSVSDHQQHCCDNNATGTGTSTVISNNNVSMDTLINPNFEELGRQFPTFGSAWKTVNESRKVVVTKGNKSNDNNDDDADADADAEPDNVTRIIHKKLSSHITQEFSIALTKALLHVYFHIGLIHIPTDEQFHLCPPVPNRYYYVHWIQNILLPMLFRTGTSSDNNNNKYFPNSSINNSNINTTIIRGLDIGTGAFCIYPLLFCSTTSSNAVMYGTDIDVNSISLAQDNVNCNNQTIKSRIHLYNVSMAYRQQQSRQRQQQQQKQKHDDNEDKMIIDDQNDDTGTMDQELQQQIFPVGPLRQSLETITITNRNNDINTTTTNNNGNNNTCLSQQQQQQQQPRIAFSMTNPPFYDVNEESNHYRGDGRTQTPMKVHEGYYPDGEYGFVLDMIIDCLYYYCSNTTTSSSPLLLLPGWISTMCGKKSTWIKIQHIVTQLLGPAHVCTTEFGPGQMTRWFIAWTFEQPYLRSPLAKLPSFDFIVNDTFSPKSNNDSNPFSIIHQVAQRIETYFHDIPDHIFMIKQRTNSSICQTDNQYCFEITETTCKLPPWKGDDELPEQIQQILQNMGTHKRVDLLPESNHHFVLDITLSYKVEQINNSKNTVVNVHVDSYHHSLYGKKLIEKVKSQIQGEICRTNRRWRRKLKREQQQQQQMDES